MANKRKTSKSPYQRYNKAPYGYSELYNRWRSAVRAGRTGEAAQLGREHTQRHLGFVPERRAA